MKRSEQRSKRINGIEQFYRNQRMTELQKRHLPVNYYTGSGKLWRGHLESFQRAVIV